MSRGEWVTLPWNGKPCRYRRDNIVSYHPVSDGATSFLLAGDGDYYSTSLPLAEFEALLFAPAEPDEYTRAAVRYAEADAACILATSGVGQAKRAEEQQEAGRIFRTLYREKRGG